VNATGALRAAADYRRNLTETQHRVLLESQGSPRTPSAADPATFLLAAESIWGGYNLSTESRAPAFSLTLFSRTRLVLRSTQLAFTQNVSVSIGGVVCNETAVSEDGQWLAFVTPDQGEVCKSGGPACAYAAMVLSNPSTDTTRGASLACPPFCTGSIRPNAGVIPLAVAHNASASFVPAEKTAQGVVNPLSTADYTSSESSEGRVYSSGLFYTVACSGNGIYTDPSTGACTNLSSPLFALCAFGGGDACMPCPPGAMCPGGSRCWSLPGFFVPSESSSLVLSCSEPGAATKCTGWSTARSETQCGEGYLQVSGLSSDMKIIFDANALHSQGSYLCGACSPAYYLGDDGTCAACPVATTIWQQYGTLILLFACILFFTAFIFLVSVAIVYAVSGSIRGLIMVRYNRVF